MKLLILCDAPGSRDEQGLRSALAEQFRTHRHAVEWLAPGQALSPQLLADSEPTLIIDGLGMHGNPCAPWLTGGAFAQLIAACNEHGWIWLLLSDSRIFSASNKRRFAETDLPAPSFSVGRQLLARENFIADTVEQHIVLRTGPLISQYGDNLLTRLVRRLRAGGEVTVPELQRFCPTPVADVARVIGALHDQLNCGATGWGAYHYESSDAAAGYEFAEVVLAAVTQYWSMAENPVHLHSAAVDSAAAVFPLLNCQRIRDTFGIQQLPWRKAIPAMLKQIHAEIDICG